MSTEVKIDNNLFNDKKMEEFIELYDDALTIQADCDPISYWIKKLEQDELRSEKTNYIKFFKIILENILGYEFTDIKYEENIGDEGRPVEFTLKKDNKDYVVVELKGTTCKDLNKRYNREQSPIEQVTNYASIKEDTQWAFVSNYNEFRLFNPSYREKYISFKFTQLTDPEVLKKFLLIFSKFSLIEKDIPQTLLKETRIIERDLEDEFYKLFSETRLMIIEELKNYSGYTNLESIRLAQLILNRFIFLCFAEDLGLIPSETTADVLLTPIKHKNLFEFTMWDRLNELFRFADKGNTERGIGAFNGGLFKESLRHLEIRDKVEDLTFFNDCYKTWKFEEKYKDIESLLGVYKDTLNPIYKNLLLISSFDFGSELSVNILGHIFENSIGDIEELKDETTERRKKDGIFYTPEYITDYICRNTIIPYLSISGTAHTIHELISEYEDSDTIDDLDKKLKDIKIIDIACGSGAILNKSVDILFEIHEALHNSKYANDETLNPYFDSLDKRKQIIINNIYGVDLNEESVEITKLSLFLKLATSTGVKEGFILPNIDTNIKCGNSVIDNENIVKNKAFNWEKEFEEIIEKGGFDLVLGNPPYVRHELINPIEKDYLANKYETFSKTSDLYICFFEKGLKILKEDGILSFICSNKYTRVKYGKKLRKFILNYNILKYIDYSAEKVFKDATVDPSTIIIKKNKNSNTINVNDSYELEQSSLNAEGWSFKSLEEHMLEQKILSKSILIKDINIEIKYGIKTGFNEAFIIDENMKNEFINLNYNNNAFIKPILKGRDIDKWQINNHEYILLMKNQQNITLNAEIKDHFAKYKEKLEKRTDKGENYWELRACAYYNLFEEDKIIWQRVCKEPNFTFDNGNHYLLDSMAFIVSKDNEYDLKYLLCFLNNPITKWHLESIGHQYSNKGFLVSNQYVNRLPVFPLKPSEQKPFIKTAEKLLELHESFVSETKSFRKWIIRTFNIDKLSQKLIEYYKLSFDEFLNEIKKHKVNIKPRETQNLLENEFENSMKIIIQLQSEIDNLEYEINHAIYKLYELTEEEVAIIENSFSK